MQILLGLIIAMAAFIGGMWYANEYDVALPIVNTPTETPTTTNGNNTGTHNPPPTSQVTYQNANADKIVVNTPAPGATVPHTFTVVGKARGGWYFEASFPVEVRGAQNQILVQMPVQADGEWMTSEFVPFSEQVSVPQGYKGPATLILRNDNPSGLPENDASISIPIVIQ